jgi:probable rRNA maturation factor
MVTAAPSSGEAGVRAGCRFDFQDPEGRLGNESLRWVSDRAREALAVIGATGEVRVRVVGDPAMAEAHARYRGTPGTTDVLTFDLGRPGGPVDADILVCADEAARQAGLRGTGVDREVLLYILHGVLHCLGFDDHDEGAAAAMHRREDEVLTAIGVGPVYARPEGGSGP